MSIEDDSARSCGCDEMSLCTYCIKDRGMPCPGLSDLMWSCDRTATTPGELRTYGHCLVCEGLADAVKRFRGVEVSRRDNFHLNELPLPGSVRHIDAARVLVLLDALLAARKVSP